MGNVIGSNKNYCIDSYVSSEVKILQSEGKNRKRCSYLVFIKISAWRESKVRPPRSLQ